MNSHTPGPWLVEHNSSIPERKQIEAVSEDGNRVLQIIVRSFNAKSDMNLVSAAPELLAVLQDLQQSASYWSEYDVPIGIVDRINAVIKKATVGKA